MRYHKALFCWKLEAFRALWRDRKGTGAIEFAIIAPLLIMAYIGCFEISVGFNVSRKVARASSTVADVLTQMPSVDKTTLEGMKAVANSVMSPFGMANYKLKMTGIKMTGPGVGKVAWSYDQAGTAPYKKDSVVTMPSDISAVDTFIVRSELVVPHEILLFAPGLSASAVNSIDISSTAYFRQRVGAEITCGDCPVFK
ncbi:pilus assembly protein [Rhizobium sp. LjRoot98]|uniref:TadE/TadG family type IV pilus assembly protein n=1 Tax=unclassified Rhizobium TaxID=2613769 RepID=UPI0007137399|nr:MULTISPECIES: TadE/TadG family type IV pilus assembly protein [unclassified Rhizobium]KQV42258.1 pilus assembly protein [Rhizobium sp. Root1204]KQY18144.1 pilus assembly protein [Rhizobium sp. Root1334]KRB98445.1 pilus assembly protein [Rhizobium sp. Root73]